MIGLGINLRKYLFVAVITVLLGATYFYRATWLPVYNEFVVGHNYVAPKVGADFVVAFEPVKDAFHPFIQQMITQAFPEYNVVFDDSVSRPNLIVLTDGMRSADSRYKGLDIPYITYSGEPKNLPRRRYRTRGLPLAQIVVFKPENDQQIYVPFYLWSGVELNTNVVREVDPNKKFLIYVSENCVKHREEFFALVKKSNDQVDAFGKCSNTAGGQRAPGGYGDLTPLYSQYNFVMAMENSQKPGYVSEKIFNAFNSGAIPIYWGDSEVVNGIFNSKAYIDLSQYKSFAAAVQHLNELVQDQEKLAQIKMEPILAENAKPWSLVVAGEGYLAQHAAKLRQLYDAKVKGGWSL